MNSENRKELKKEDDAKVTDEQIGKLFDQVRPGIHESGIFTGETFQKMIDQEKLLNIRSRVVDLLDQIASEVADSLVISVNYHEVDAVANAIKAGAFDKRYVDIDIDDIPLQGSGQVEREVFELHLGRAISSKGLLAELDSREATFADPLTALRYAVKLPNLYHPLGILFDSKKGLFCNMVLLGYGKRQLFVHAGNPDDPWNERCGFLVVRKSLMEPNWLLIQSGEPQMDIALGPSLVPAIQISAVNWIAPNALVIKGMGFGDTPQVFINGDDKSGRIRSASDTSITLKKKLGLVPGANRILVRSSKGMASYWDTPAGWDPITWSTMAMETPLITSEAVQAERLTRRRAEDTGLIPDRWKVYVTEEGVRKDKREGDVDLAKVDYACPLNDSDGDAITGEVMLQRALEMKAHGSLGYAFELLEAQKQGKEIFPAESRGEHYFIMPLTELLADNGRRYVAVFHWDTGHFDRPRQWALGFESVDPKHFHRRDRFVVPREEKPSVA